MAEFLSEQQWAIWDDLAGASRLPHPFLCLDLPEYDAAALDAAVEAVLRRYAMLRTAFPLVRGIVRPVVSEPGSVELEKVGLREDDDEGLAQVLARARSQPFDVATGPLMRGVAVSLGAHRHALLVVLHPAVCAEIPARRIERELRAHYEGLPLAPVPRPCGREQSLAYWEQTLAGAPLVTRLPIARARATALVMATVPGSVSTRLATMLGCRMPLELRLLAAFLVLVARSVGREDVVVSYVVEDRRSLIRAVLRDGWPFPKLLAATFYATNGARLHDGLAPESVLEHTLGPRAARHGLVPAVDVEFEWSDREMATPHCQPQAASVESTDERCSSAWSIEAPSGAFLRMVAGRDRSGRLVCEVAGDFHPESGRRVLGQYLNLLEQVAANPVCTLRSLSVLSDEEAAGFDHRMRSLVAGPSVLTLARRFGDQVRQHPDWPAVVDGDAVCSYGELDGWAEAVNQHLRAAKLMPRPRIGVSARPGPAAVAAVLGIWRAGGTYVGLSERDPRRRIGEVVEQSRVHAVLYDHSVSEPAGRRVVQLVIPSSPSGCEARLQTVMPRGVDLACIFYGSSNSPVRAGVMVTHNAIASLVSVIGRDWCRSDGDGRKPPGLLFDASPADHRFLRQLAALAWGGTLHVTGSGGATPPLREAGESDGSPEVGFGAEAVAIVLDRRGQPVPTGAAGDLYLGGDGLFRGYYGHPELTEECVVTARQGDGRPVRLYRTGRAARFLPGGSVEVLGPIDEYVEFEGFRIRLGRIEAALARCPGVANVSLAVHGNQAEGQRLVAHVVAEGTPTSQRQLREFLWRELPECPWPSEVVSDGMKLPPDDSDDGLFTAAWAEVLGVAGMPANASYWGSFAFLEAVERVRAAGVAVTEEHVRRHRTPEALAIALATA